MRSQWRRLFWAAFLSGCGFAATITWYKSTEKSTRTRSEIPLAQVGKVGDEVLRRSATRLLWNSVSTGDSLFNGETIRTSDKGEIRIQFEDGRFIDLEADSMIVLKKNQGEIALDLMEGSLFVNAQATLPTQANEADSSSAANAKQKTGLVVNSGQGKVDLTGSSANLARGQGTALDVQVVEGKAQFQNKNGQTQEITKGHSSALSSLGLTSQQLNLKILSPSIDQPTLVDPQIENKLTFQWKGFPTNAKVILLSGQRRKELQEVGSTDGQSDKIIASIPMGKNFWKLIAKDVLTSKVVAESSIYKLDVIGRFAPTVIYPTAELQVLTTNPVYDMSFKWQKGDEAKKVFLEVATDLTFKNKILNQSFTSEDQFLLSKLKDGDYFWRMSAYYADTEKPIIGKIQHFIIKKPAPELPKEPARIGWLTPETSTVQYFVNEPTLQLQWKAETRTDEIKSWQLLVLENGARPEEQQKINTQEPQVKTRLSKPGQFKILVIALNKEGKSIGQSSERTMTLQSFPLLSSPRILPFEGELKAFDDGRTDLTWENINGAKEYNLVIKNQSGHELARKKYSSAQTNLKGLLPGKYMLQVMAIDQYGRSSEEPPSRILVVPDKSNVRAPSNFRVKVKDK